MNTNGYDPTIDLDAIGKIASEQEQLVSDDEIEVVETNLTSKLNNTENTEPGAAPIPVEEETTDEYEGPGLVINQENFTEETTEEPIYSGLQKNTMDNIENYLNEMDYEIEAFAEAEAEEKKAEDDESEDTEETDDELDRDDFIEGYEKAVVIIDKTNFGTVINFTDEEREKLEKSRKIKLEEVETVSLKSIKTKKLKKKDDFNKIINRVTNITTTNIVLPASGYTAAIKGCSAYELVSLIQENKNALINAQDKWSLIYNKLDSTSIGKMSFDEFMHNTASVDYNTFIYGLLCSTYPDDDKLPITCPKCKKEFEHLYSTRSLIRVEKMDEVLQDTIMKIVDNSVTEASAKAVHDESPISIVKTIKLPVSGIIAEVYVQSAYDLINKSIKGLQENKDSKYNNAAVLSTFIRTFYIYDESDGSYFTVDDANDILQTLYSLSEVDVLVIRNMGDKLVEHTTVEYGLMDITCPHCKHYMPTLDLELENILFYRYRQILNTEIV